MLKYELNCNDLWTGHENEEEMEDPEIQLDGKTEKKIRLILLSM